MDPSYVRCLSKGQIRRGHCDTLQRWIDACGAGGNLGIKFNGTIFTFGAREPQEQYDADCHRRDGMYWWQNAHPPYWSMLDYYDFTQDGKFLRKTLLPPADEVITFCDQHWPRNDKGKIHFEPAQAPAI